MLAEILTFEPDGCLAGLLSSYPHKPFCWALGEQEQGPAVGFLTDNVRCAVERGGIAMSYRLSGRVVGLCVVSPDEWAAEELQSKCFSISHLIAEGSPEAQCLVKSLLVRESMRELGSQACYVARVPASDLSSVNTLQRMGFVATQSQVVLAKVLSSEPGAKSSGLERTYEVQRVNPGEVDQVLEGLYPNRISTVENRIGDWSRSASPCGEHPLRGEHPRHGEHPQVSIPAGMMGWDAKLSRSTLSKVHADWLRTYASGQSLFVAHDRGRPVGLLAEHVWTDTSQLLGTSVGSIDLVTTAPEYRNNGVVPELLASSLGVFASQGVGLARAVAYADDMPVIRSCQSAGFVTVENQLILARLPRIGWGTPTMNDER